MLFHFVFILISTKTFSLHNRCVLGKALLSCTKGNTILQARFHHKAGKGKGVSLCSLILPMTDTAWAPFSCSSSALPSETATVWHHYFFLLAAWFSVNEAHCVELHTAYRAVLCIFFISHLNLKKKRIYMRCTQFIGLSLFSWPFLWVVTSMSWIRNNWQCGSRHSTTTTGAHAYPISPQPFSKAQSKRHLPVWKASGLSQDWW